MIIRKFEDLKNPLFQFWKEVGYRNTSYRSQINIVCNEKKKITDFSVAIQEMVLHAVRGYSNLEVILSFHPSKELAMNYYREELSSHYHLWGFRKMDFQSDDPKARQERIHKMMYQLLYPRNKSKKYIREHWSMEEESNEIFVYFLCKKRLDIDFWSDKTTTLVFAPATVEERHITASIVFHDESWNMIRLQNFDYLNTSEMAPSKEMYDTYREWLMRYISMDKQPFFMLYSSILFYFLGHRNINDMDLYIHSSKEEEDIHEIVTETLTFPFMDYSMKNTKKWPRYWNKWLDEWARMCGAKYFEDILCNPIYHFYYVGVKIISLHCDMKRRIYRNRPRAIADLISLRKRYGVSMVLPPIPQEMNEYVDVSEKTSEEIAVMLKEDCKYNHAFQEIVYVKSVDETQFLKTVQWALKERYRMTFSMEEILHELELSTSSRKREESRLDIHVSDRNQTKVESTLPEERKIQPQLEKKEILSLEKSIEKPLKKPVKIRIKKK
jgi:hypothetical protein